MRIWLLSDYDDGKYFAFSSLTARFSRQFPGVKAEFTVKNPETVWNELFQSLRDPKNHPVADIVEIPHKWTSIFSKLGLFMEIPQIIESFSPEEYPEFVRSGMKLEGSEYYFSLPLWLEIMNLQYREDLLAGAVSGKDMQMLTWPDFLDICSFLARKKKKKDFFPVDNFNLSGSVSADDALFSVLNRSDGYFSQDLSRLNVMKEEVLAGLDDFLSLSREGYMPLFQENFYELEFLKEGLSAMAFSWRLPGVAGKVRLHPAQPPTIRRKKNPARTWNLAVSSSTEELNETKIFMNWLFSEENLEYLRKSMGVLGARKKELHKAFAAGKNSVFENMLPGLSLIPNFGVYPTFDFLLNKILFETCLEIAKKEYSRENLLRKIAVLKGEIDYLLSVY